MTPVDAVVVDSRYLCQLARCGPLSRCIYRSTRCYADFWAQALQPPEMYATPHGTLHLNHPRLPGMISPRCCFDVFLFRNRRSPPPLVRSTVLYGTTLFVNIMALMVSIILTKGS